MILAPEGALHAIPWHVLHDGKQALLDRYSIQYVSSGRDLLRTPSQILSGQAIVVAATDAPKQRPLNQARAAAPMLAQRQHAQLFAGTEATEENLRRATSPWTLTLISHGLFEDGPFVRQSLSGRARQQPPHGSAGFAAVESLFAKTLVRDTAPIDVGGLFDVENALHRSALALMPGLHAQSDATQDGWLTGDEAQELSLSGTRLVTILACQSGRGGLSVGQGVYGMRRAFLQAGAETVVSTLWSVHEPSATALVQRYIETLISGPKKGRMEAIEEAMKHLRGDQRHPEYSHPYYWAPFVVMGADGPLLPPAAPTKSQ